MDDVRCSGTENSLSDCAFAGWSKHNCDHTEDAAVVCESECQYLGCTSLLVN